MILGQEASPWLLQKSALVVRAAGSSNWYAVRVCLLKFSVHAKLFLRNVFVHIVLCWNVSIPFLYPSMSFKKT